MEPEVLGRLDLEAAATRELTSRNRLLPPRYDYRVLAGRGGDVARLLRPEIRRGGFSAAGDVVFADKGWRGSRPLTVMPLVERVLFRALVEALRPQLPPRVAGRTSFAEFRGAPLAVEGAKYVSKTDVAAYYEYVDHEILEEELIAQTGDEPLVLALIELLGRVMGRRLGLPQVHTASDVLGDTYIDRARRALRRRGHSVFTYADDFRIASASLGESRHALSDVAQEVRVLGLVLNERKTLTYTRKNYAESLEAFARAEEALFADAEHDVSGLTLLRAGYDEDVDESQPDALRLGAEPLHGEVDDQEVLVDDTGDDADPPALDPALVTAARRAWQVWLNEDESDEIQAGQNAAITQSLLSRALPVLGDAGETGPLQYLEEILRYEPALTPEVSDYVSRLGRADTQSRTEIWGVLDDVVGSELLSTWQSMWIAHAAGTVPRPRFSRAHVQWLTGCVEDGPDELAATAAAALGRIERGQQEVLAQALNRVGPGWRRLVLWSYARLNPSAALDAADDALDRLVLEGIT